MGKCLWASRGVCPLGGGGLVFTCQVPLGRFPVETAHCGFQMDPKPESERSLVNSHGRHRQFPAQALVYRVKLLTYIFWREGCLFHPVAQGAALGCSWLRVHTEPSLLSLCDGKSQKSSYFAQTGYQEPQGHLRCHFTWNSGDFKCFFVLTFAQRFP